MNEAGLNEHNAINKTLEAMAAGDDRILLTLATGTDYSERTGIATQGRDIFAL